MARLEFRLPDIGEGVAEAEIVEWHAAPGDRVEEGQVVVAVMTDKATVELEAPATGTLAERHGAIGDAVPVGAVLFAMEADGSAEATEADASGPRPAEAVPVTSPPAPARVVRTEAAAAAGKVLASPAVRQRARALGLDLAAVPVSGDRVRHADLDAYLLSQGAAPVAGLPTPGPGSSERPVAGLRRQIARRMAEAHRRVPPFTYVDEIDVTSLEAHRETLNAARGERPALHVLPFVILAMCRALRTFPDLNAHYDERRDVLVRYDPVHLGIATQTDAGLMVPVLHDAGALDGWQLAGAIADLAGRARAGHAGRDELRGSTITVTSLGRLGGIAATPIVNWPEVAILAPHRVMERIVPVNGAAAVRRMMNLSITCDHRVIDGQVAAEFVAVMGAALQAPEDLVPL